MYNVKEKDWKLFRKKIIIWQENYMDKLNHEYIELLQRKNSPSTKFWELEKRISNDKRSVGVVVSMKRSTMFENIVSLINDDIITFEDLDEFSNELKENIEVILNWRKI